MILWVLKLLYLEIGYNKEGWFNSSGDLCNSFDDTTSMDILYAKYTPKNYSISYKY